MGSSAVQLQLLIFENFKWQQYTHVINAHSKHVAALGENSCCNAIPNVQRISSIGDLPMAVSLTVTTEDAALEDLLRYLDAHGNHPHTSSKLWLLNKATKWLNATLAVSYDTATVKATLDLGGAASATPEPPCNELIQQRH